MGWNRINNKLYWPPLRFNVITFGIPLFIDNSEMNYRGAEYNYTEP